MSCQSTIWQYSNKEIYYRVSFNACSLRQHRANVNVEAISLIDCLDQILQRQKKIAFFKKKVKYFSVFLQTLRLQNLYS